LPVVVGARAGLADLDALLLTNGPAGRKPGVPGRPGDRRGRLIGDRGQLDRETAHQGAISGGRSVELVPAQACLPLLRPADVVEDGTVKILHTRPGISR